ncbi:MAG: hypothetical protein U0002_22405 [Thermoanaerobaculia bacterium]
MRTCRFVLACLALLVMSGVPALAQDEVCLPAGSDLWRTTSTGTHALIPAGFLCPDSQPFEVAFEGAPLASEPPLGNTDTVVLRTKDFCFSGGEGDVGVVLWALSLKATTTVNATAVGCDGGPWTVTAHRTRDLGEERPIHVVREGDYGGTFSGSLAVPVEIRFQRYKDKDLTLADTIVFEMQGVWASEPGPGATVAEGDLRVDTNGDGDLSDEQAIPGTARPGFFPGWSGSTTWPPVAVPIRHEAPQHSHFTLPPLPDPPGTCDRRVVTYLQEAQARNLKNLVQVGDTLVVAVDPKALVTRRSLKSLIPCEWVDQAQVYVVGAQRAE